VFFRLLSIFTKKHEKIGILLLIFSCFIGLLNQAQSTKSAPNKQIKKLQNMQKQTIYQFKVEDLQGKSFDFADLKGKKS